MSTTTNKRAKPRMCFFSPKPSKSPSSSSKHKTPTPSSAMKPKPIFTVHENRTSALPSQVQILRKNDGDESGLPVFETYISEKEWKRRDMMAEEKRVVERERGELERYKEKEEKAKREGKEVKERARAREAWEEKAQVEKLRKENMLLKMGMKGGGMGVGMGLLEVGEGDGDEEDGWTRGDLMHVSSYQSLQEHPFQQYPTRQQHLFNQQQHHVQQQNPLRQQNLPQNQMQWHSMNAIQARNHRQQEILDGVDFVQALGQRFVPLPVKQDKHEEKKENIEIAGLRKEMNDMKLERRLDKVRAEERQAGLKLGREKAMKEMEIQMALERSLQVHLNNNDRERKKRILRKERQRVWQDDSDSDSEDTLIYDQTRRRDRRRIRDKDDNYTTTLKPAELKADTPLDLTALAKLPGRWNFSISSPTYPPPPNTPRHAQHSINNVPQGHTTQFLDIHDRLGKIEAALPKQLTQFERMQFGVPMEVLEREMVEQLRERERDMDRVWREKVVEMELREQRVGVLFGGGRGRGAWGRGPVGWGA